VRVDLYTSSAVLNADETVTLRLLVHGTARPTNRPFVWALITLPCSLVECVPSTDPAEPPVDQPVRLADLIAERDALEQAERERIERERRERRALEEETRP
jgi:hypothetical protein